MSDFYRQLTQAEIGLFDMGQVLVLNEALEGFYTYIPAWKSPYLADLKKRLPTLMGVSLFLLDTEADAPQHAHTDANVLVPTPSYSRLSAVNFTLGVCKVDWWTDVNPTLVKYSDSHGQHIYPLADNEKIAEAVLQTPTLINVNIPHRGYMATKKETTVVSFGFSSSFDTLDLKAQAVK